MPIAAAHDAAHLLLLFCLVPLSLGVDGERKEPHPAFLDDGETIGPVSILRFLVHAIQVALVFQHAFFCPWGATKPERIVFEQHVSSHVLINTANV